MTDDVQKRILRKTAEMFFRLGIRSVSIDDICHELGISKKTFYVYFESKDALVAQLLHISLNHMVEKMEEWLHLHDFRQLISILFAPNETDKEDVRRVPQLVYDLKKYYPVHFADFQSQLFEEQKKYLTEYLKKGIAEGLVRANINIETTAVLFAKFHSDTIRDIESIEAHGYNMRHYSQIAKDICVRGVLSEKGLALYEGSENDKGK